MKATIGGIFSATFDFLKANWLIMVGMLLAACVVLGLLGYLMVGSFFSQALAGVEPDPSVVIGMMAQFLLFYLIMLVVLHGVGLSVWRHGLTNGKDPAPANLGWALLGGVTLALFYLGLVIAFYIALAIIMVVLFAVVGGSMAMFEPGGFSPETMAGPAIALVVLLYIAIIAASLWLWARLSIIGPVMAAERTVNPFTGLVQSWRLTQPSQWKIVGFLLVAIIAMMVLLVVTGIVGGAARVPWLVILAYVPVLLFWWAAPPGIYRQVASIDRSSVFA